MPLSTSSIFTVAPGMTAPAESVTTPRMLPELVFCAIAAKAGNNRARQRLARIHCFMLPPGVVPNLLALNSSLWPALLSFCFLRAAAGHPTVGLTTPDHGREGPQPPQTRSVYPRGSLEREICLLPDSGRADTRQRFAVFVRNRWSP